MTYVRKKAVRVFKVSKETNDSLERFRAQERAKCLTDSKFPAFQLPLLSPNPAIFSHFHTVQKASRTKMSTSDETAAEEPRQGNWWSKAEHDSFLQALQEHGKNWKLIAEAVGSRTVSQVRSHAQKYFLKLERQKARLQRRGLGELKAQGNRSDKLAYENHLLRCYIQTLANVNIAFLHEFKQAFQGEELPRALEHSALLASAFPPPFLM